MYLTQLALNLRSRYAQRELADRFELHRTLMAAFHADLPSDERILFRVEPQRNQLATLILVQSKEQPDWNASAPLQRDGYLITLPRIRQISIPTLTVGQPIMFRLLANPTVKRDGKRHALYHDDKCLEWLERKGKQHGFEVNPLDVRINHLGRAFGKGRKQVWHGTQFDGRLVVREPSGFADALRNGVGSAKAFGFGLLSIPYPST